MKDTDLISPFSRLRFSDMLKACQTLLDTTAMWNDAYHKDSIYDLRKELEQARKEIYNLRILSNQRITGLEYELRSMRHLLNLPSRRQFRLGDRPRFYNESEEGSDDAEFRVENVDRCEEVEAIYLSTSNSCSSSLSFEEQGGEGSLPSGGGGGDDDEEDDGYFSVPCSPV